MIYTLTTERQNTTYDIHSGNRNTEHYDIHSGNRNTEHYDIHMATETQNTMTYTVKHFFDVVFFK